MQSINSIVWNKNVIDKAPVYCDICRFMILSSLGRLMNHPTASRIQVALNVAVPACTLCITHRLFKIATAKTVMPTGAKKRRAVMADLCIGLGIPILQMILREFAQRPPTFSRLFCLHGCNRVCCFGKSLPLIRGFRSLPLDCGYATILLPRLGVAYSN
jgi:hypothetical protein